jgi:hypothetical protein
MVPKDVFEKYFSKKREVGLIDCFIEDEEQKSGKMSGA